jgi:hypothetical protein
MSKGGNHSKSGGSVGRTLGYDGKDKLGQQKFTFNKQKPRTGRFKVVDGKRYELHPTKGWKKLRCKEE